MKFGLSPFGIWRPGYPESVAGFDQYEQLYADAKLWLNKGWIDYFTPQLYWPINRQNASFPVLLGWWAGENTMKRHLWPGMSVGRDTSIRSVNETLNQIMITRGMVPESKGAVHWSISSVTKNPNLAKALLESTYKKQAIVPASPWLDTKAPDAPKVSTSKTDKITISWSHPDERDVFRWVVYFKYGNNWNYTILNRNERSFTLNPGTEVNKKIVDLKEVAVTAVDRTGNESTRNQIAIN